MSETDVIYKFLRVHLTYSDGKLIWIKNPPNCRKNIVGRRFGNKHNKGYWHGTIKGSKHLEHRLIWLYHYGVWPKDQLDHINGIRDDNRIENLREASNSENQRNRKNTQASSKYKGVSWYPNYSKWSAHFSAEGKRKFIGYFDREIDAAKAYNTKALEFYGEFARLNVFKV